ncbi:hypothetical protein Tco_1081450 [Tanacetum coccineum]|uniref:Uncharacterized protein n=1 Tax=Tanacetum coccineum TaxID=301880 RepID=A0ABQ5HXL1_9ASTR
MKIPELADIRQNGKHTEHYQMYAEVFGIDVPLTQSWPTDSTQGTYRSTSAPRSPNLKVDAGKSSATKRSQLIFDEEKKLVKLWTTTEQALGHPWKVKRWPSEVIWKVSRGEITNVVILVTLMEGRRWKINMMKVMNVKQREKGKIVEESRSTPSPIPIRSHRGFFQELQDVMVCVEHLKAKFLSRKSFDTLADHLQEVMVESLPTMVDKHIKEQVVKQVPEQVKVYSSRWDDYRLEISSLIQQAIENNIPSRTSALRPRDQDDPRNDAPPEGENSAKRQKTSEYKTYVTGELSGQVNESEQCPSSSANQEQVDDYDFWTESYASDDYEIPTKQVSQDIMEEVSLTINEAELKKITNETLRQRCTLGDEHQYHIDQMKNFLKSDIVWESKKEILASTHLRKTTPLVQSCQRDPKAPALSLINQDLLYLKKGNSGPEKIVLSLHKFPAIIFNDVDIEERSSRWVNKYVKKFNPYARYGVEHYKNPHAKIFYIKRQKKPGKPKEVVYSNSKIIQVIKTYWELGQR